MSLDCGPTPSSTASSEPAATSPRVLFVIPGEEEGALFVFAKREVAAVMKLGVQGRVFYLCSRTSPWMLLREAIRFRKEIARFRPNLIHSHYGSMTALFAVMGRPTPIIVTYRGRDLNPWLLSNTPAGIREGAARLLSQLAALGACRIICVSEELHSRLWWKRSVAEVIPSGIDAELFVPSSRDAARTRLGWRADEKILLFNAGRSPERKRLDLARAAHKFAQELVGEVRMVVLDGYVEPELVPIYMNAADCLIQTSDSEGSPNIVKESIACNLPVVSVDVGDTRDRLSGLEGCCITERDAAKLGAAVAEVLRKGERINGYESVRDVSLAVTALRVREVYRGVLCPGVRAGSAPPAAERPART